MIDIDLITSVAQIGLLVFIAGWQLRGHFGKALSKVGIKKEISPKGNPGHLEHIREQLDRLVSQHDQYLPDKDSVLFDLVGEREESWKNITVVSQQRDIKAILDVVVEKLDEMIDLMKAA